MRWAGDLAAGAGPSEGVSDRPLMGVRRESTCRWAFDTSVEFHRTSGSLGDQCLGGMECGEIGRTSRRLIVIHRQHAVGLALQIFGLCQDVGFGRQRSIPSNRISCISGGCS